MIAATDNAQYGLRAAIEGIKEPPLSCVIILARTNDLGFALMTEVTNNYPAQTMLQDIQALYQIAWDASVQHTIAVAIPPSGYQTQMAKTSFLALQINEVLEDFSNKQSISLCIYLLPRRRQRCQYLKPRWPSF